MTDVFPKFVIEDDALILGMITYHHELVIDKSKVKGGGWFRYEEKNNRFVFYGESEDFKGARLEDIRQCIKEGKVFTNKFQTHSIAHKHKFAYDTQSEIIDLS